MQCSREGGESNNNNPKQQCRGDQRPEALGVRAWGQPRLMSMASHFPTTISAAFTSSSGLLALNWTTKGLSSPHVENISSLYFGCSTKSLEWIIGV